MIPHGMDPIKQQTAKYPSPGSDVYKCLKWEGAYINEMTTEIAAGNIKKQVHALTTQAKFWEAPPHNNLHYLRQPKPSHPPKPNKPPNQQKQ